MQTTYHGIFKATCLSCGNETTDLDELVALNDVDNYCFKCETRFTKWETNEGTFITCEIEDYRGGTYHFREEVK